MHAIILSFRPSEKCKDTIGVAKSLLSFKSAHAMCVDASVVLAGEAPEARRASAGILAHINGTATLVIWSGRNKRNKMLRDVWMAPLTGPEIVWDRIPDKSADDEVLLAEEGEDEMGLEEERILDLFRKKEHQKGKKKKKKKKKKERKKDRHFPAPRKGHLALYVETEDRQLMVTFSSSK